MSFGIFERFKKVFVPELYAASNESETLTFKITEFCQKEEETH